jgi:hypothetical protein
MVTKTKTPSFWGPGVSHSVKAFQQQAGNPSYNKPGSLSNRTANALRRSLALATEPGLRGRLTAAIADLERRRP